MKFKRANSAKMTIKRISEYSLKDAAEKYGFKVFTRRNDDEDRWTVQTKSFTIKAKIVGEDLPKTFAINDIFENRVVVKSLTIFTNDGEGLTFKNT